jgi:hypothetical protein
MNEKRRVFDFIMGGCAGFCFFHGQFIGYAIGTLMLVSFVIYAYRTKMLAKIDEEVAQEQKEEENGIGE